MKDIFFQYPKVLTLRYIDILTPDTFCVLMRLYSLYLENLNERIIKISYSDFHKRILFDNSYEQAKRIWYELRCFEFVRIFYKENIYELNITKIREENREFLNHNIKVKKRRFHFQIIGKSLVREKTDEKPEISTFIEKFIYRYSKRIQNSIRKLIAGVIEYYIKTEKNVKISNISKTLMMLLEIEDDKIVEDVCDIYNSNIEKYGKVHPNYIKGIIKNLKDCKEKIVEQKSYKQKSLEKFKKMKEISDRDFSIKIATGEIEGNISYQAIIDLKNFDRLNKLYKMGCEILKNEKRESEIVSNYIWLKK